MRIDIKIIADNGVIAAVVYATQTHLLTIASETHLPCTMEDPYVAHNCAQSPVARVEMTHVAAQDQLASLIIKLSSCTVLHWWKLLGDEPNSLCKFLDMPYSDMRLVLRKCHILYGEGDKFRTSEYEKLMAQIGCDYTTYRPCGKPEHFIKLGDKTEDAAAINKPKEMYSIGGILERMPVVGIHLPGIRTKL